MSRVEWVLRLVATVSKSDSDSACWNFFEELGSCALFASGLGLVSCVASEVSSASAALVLGLVLLSDLFSAASLQADPKIMSTSASCLVPPALRISSRQMIRRSLFAAKSLQQDGFPCVQNLQPRCIFLHACPVAEYLAFTWLHGLG